MCVPSDLDLPFRIPKTWMICGFFSKGSFRVGFFFFETRGSRNSWGVKVEGRVCWNEIVLKTTLDDCL